jgi:predicted house-cleaning noncanonical NTP pyrophosphatase (MazG superfamily)
MESILDIIYNGKTPIIAGNIDSEEYKQALAAYEKLYQEFVTGLEAKRRGSLEELMDCRNCLESVNEKHFFIEGFKLGMRIMLEVLA